MSLPPLAELPPPSIRLSISSEEWTAILDSFTTLTALYYRLPDQSLSTALYEPSSLIDFLKSFYHGFARANSSDGGLHNAEAIALRRNCFLLTRRILLNTRQGVELLDFDFVADLCRSHARMSKLPGLMGALWQREDHGFQKAVEAKKASLLKGLDRKPTASLPEDLRQLVDVFRVSPESAAAFMTGSDFLDGLISQYDKSSSGDVRDSIIATVYFGVRALSEVEHPNISLLSDHIFTLKSHADRREGERSLLADVVSNTPLVRKLRQISIGNVTSRLDNTLNTLETYRATSSTLHRKHKPKSKGKDKAIHQHAEMHMHRMSLVTQIQDLFPDLGAGFVLKLLDEYNDSVEEATAHLLEDSLSPHLRALDRTEQAPISSSTHQAVAEDLAPKLTPPMQPYIPERHNVFDDDELDGLELGTAKLHVGKRDEGPAEDQPNKAAILAALAAFDSDDDERDDTYDVEDVGGTIDTAHPDGEPGPSARITQEENDMALFSAYRSSPALFGRTFDVRKGQARQALKAETGLTDEQIEGWTTMLQRDPRRLKRLEAQYGAFDGKQAELSRTAYRESPGGTETEDSDVPADRGGYRGRGYGRGRGRGGRRRGGGNAAGPSSDPSTAAAQRRKEANKGSRANHNRRDQRAKKMARGGL
jgi:activating signal cointegrator complex subunit 2